MEMSFIKKKPYSKIEKRLLINLVDRFSDVITCRKTDATSSAIKMQTWEKITNEFNRSPFVCEQVTSKQLIKLWNNLKAKAKIKETQQNTSGASSDLDETDAIVLSIDKNIANVDVDMDGVIKSDLIHELNGDDNSDSWPQAKSQDSEYSMKRTRMNHHVPAETCVKDLKIQSLQQDIEHKREIHERKLEFMAAERQLKEESIKLELKIKQRMLDYVNLQYAVLEKQMNR